MKRYLVVILFFGLIQCQTEPEIPATVISFEDDVKPVILSTCAYSNCHTSGGEQFPLETYSSIVAHVEPGKPTKSALYQVIILSGGEKAMPPDTPLSNQQIALIYTWILQGAPNN